MVLCRSKHWPAAIDGKIHQNSCVLPRAVGSGFALGGVVADRRGACFTPCVPLVLLLNDGAVPRASGWRREDILLSFRFLDREFRGLYEDILLCQMYLEFETRRDLGMRTVGVGWSTMDTVAYNDGVQWVTAEPRRSQAQSPG